MHILHAYIPTRCFRPLIQACVLLLSFISVTDTRAATAFRPGVSVGVLNSSAITEASGLVASRRNPGVLWVHNDAGFVIRIYAISTNGLLLSTWEVPGIFGGDTEDITIGPGPVSGIPYIYLGDIGDNDETRANIRVIRVPEPEVALNTAGNPPTRQFGQGAEIVLTYPDRAQNSEALISDPWTGDLFIASKNELLDASFLYRVPKAALDLGGAIVMEYQGPLRSRNISAADISPNGGEILIRSGNSGAVWKRAPGKTVAQTLRAGGALAPVIGEPLEPNGESIAFDLAGRGYYTLSEGLFQPLYFFARSGASPEATVLKQGRWEQPVTITFKGASITNESIPKPLRVNITTRSFLSAVGSNIAAGSNLGKSATLILQTSPAGDQRFLMRQKGFPDYDISSFLPTFDEGNDDDEAVIIPSGPGLPYKINSEGRFVFQFGPEHVVLTAIGPTANRVFPKVIRLLGIPLTLELSQVMAKPAAVLFEFDDIKATLVGTVAVGAPKATDLTAFFAESFDVWNGNFVVVNNGPVHAPWTYQPPVAPQTNGTWQVGANTAGEPTISALRTRSFVVTTTGDAALVFDHRYNFHREGVGGHDGGLIRFRVNNGDFFVLPEDYFISHGYTVLLFPGNPLEGQAAFSGTSGGYETGNYIRSMAGLGSFLAGDVITIEFVAAWNDTVGNEGANWDIANAAVVRW